MEPDDLDDLTPLFTAPQDDRYDIRRQAQEALWQLHSPAVVPALLAGLAIPDRRVRTLIVTLLGELGDQRAIVSLIEVLRTSEAGDVFANPCAQVAEALGRLGDLRAVEPLIAETHAMRNPSGATILGNLGDRRAVEPLLADLESLRQAAVATNLPAVPWQASYYYYVIRALGKLGDPRAVPLLESIRDHERDPVLKRKSLGDAAAAVLRRIAERAATEADAGGEAGPEASGVDGGTTR